MEENKKKIMGTLEENVAYMNEVLPVKESFDLVQRDIVIGGKKSSFFFIDGFTKDDTMLKIMTSFFSVTEEKMPDSATEFSRLLVPYVEVDTLSEFDGIIKNLLSGTTCLFVDGYEACIVIDCRTYPARGVDEPYNDKSLRGPRDGFVETIVFNTALMRRRIPTFISRSKPFRMKIWMASSRRPCRILIRRRTSFLHAAVKSCVM